MPRRTRASKETFGATCCDRPRFERAPSLVPRDGAGGLVYRCRGKHRARYFVVWTKETNAAVRVARGDLRLRKDGDAVPPSNRPGRAANTPSGQRALVEHERAAVAAARAESAGEAREKEETHPAASLTGELWLSCVAIDSGLDAVARRARRRCVHLGSLFYAKLTEDGRRYRYENVARWTARRGVDLFAAAAAEVFFVPVNVGRNHWALVSVDLVARRMTYLDSMLPRGALARRKRTRPLFAALQRFLEDEWWAKRGEWGKEAAPPPFEEAVAEDAPQQENGHDCGVFALCFADAIARGGTIRTARVRQRDMAHHRARIAADIECARLGRPDDDDDDGKEEDAGDSESTGVEEVEA